MCRMPPMDYRPGTGTYTMSILTNCRSKVVEKMIVAPVIGSFVFLFIVRLL